MDSKVTYISISDVCRRAIGTTKGILVTRSDGSEPELYMSSSVDALISHMMVASGNYIQDNSSSQLSYDKYIVRSCKFNKIITFQLLNFTTEDMKAVEAVEFSCPSGH